MATALQAGKCTFAQHRKGNATSMAPLFARSLVNNSITYQVQHYVMLFLARLRTNSGGTHVSMAFSAQNPSLASVQIHEVLQRASQSQ